MIRRQKRFSSLITVFKLRNLYLLMQRGYLVDGEDLPDESKKKSKLVYVGTAASFVVFFLVLNYLKNVVMALQPAIVAFLEKGFGRESFEALDLIEWFNVSYFMGTWPLVIVSVVVACIPSFMMYKKLSLKFDKLNYGQRGDNRLTTLEEIQEQYHAIPDRVEEYEGIGGVQIAHYKNKFYIDRDTVNTCYVGTSRSGKGEMFVTILMDILSRAQEKCAMVTSDPKGELYACAKETLEKRGYEVQVLNAQDPMQSMSYNPLQLIIDAWKQGDKATAQMLVNTFSYAVFNNPNAGANKWVYDAAQKVVNGVILALIDECDQNNELEKIALYNVGQMVNEMNALKIVCPITKKETSALDEYFNRLPQGHMAKGQYASATAANDKAKGSILQTVIDGLTIFQMETIAKMTSKNSFDLKSVGFPKSILIKFHSSLFDKDLKVKFYKEEKLVAMENIRPNLNGIVSLNFQAEIQTGDTIEIHYKDGEKSVVYRLKRIWNEEKKEYEKTVELEKMEDTLQLVETIDMQYSEKPLAVFMITPDYDPSRNVIASTFIKQLYTTLAQNASNTRGKKCHRRVHMILDEFGNLPAIESMDSIMTVCLGRNILFNLFLQSYEQLEGVYGKTAAKTIKENSQNHIVRDVRCVI